MNRIHRLLDDGADLPCTLPEDLLNLVRITLQIRPCSSCVSEVLKKGLKKFLLGVTVSITDACGSHLVRHLVDFFLRRDQLVEFMDRVALGVLGIVHPLRIGDDSHDLFSKFFLRFKDPQVIPVGFAHLLAIHTGNLGSLSFQDQWLGKWKHFAIQLIELSCDIPGHLYVLLLILSHRNTMGPDDQNVCCHETWIGEKTMVRRNSFFDLVLVGMTTLKESHGGQCRENPGQLTNLWNIFLPVNHRFFGIESQSQIITGNTKNVIAECFGFFDGGQGVVGGDEIVSSALPLEVDPLANSTEVVPQMDSRTGRSQSRECDLTHR